MLEKSVLELIAHLTVKDSLDRSDFIRIDSLVEFN